MSSFVAQLYQMLFEAFSNPFQEPLPHTIEKLKAESDKIMSNYRRRGGKIYFAWRHSRRPRLPYAKPKDTPAAAFFRIYQFIILDEVIYYRNELEYFCCKHPEWAIHALPDPKDFASPSRYAALAATTYLIVESFNRRIELGLPRDAPPIVEDFEELARRPKVLERVPDWAGAVQSLPHTLYIPDRKGHMVQDDAPEVSLAFKKYNIIMEEPHVHFI